MVKSGWGFRFGEILSLGMVIVSLLWSLVPPFKGRTEEDRRQPPDVAMLVLAIPLLGLLSFWFFLVYWPG